MADYEHFDVVIVGAGLSGVGAAAHLRRRCPDRSFVILEGRERIGGTWDLFRYPGVRSDSDMHTLGYAFRPWTDAKAIADGPTILSYIQGAARDEGVTAHIRLRHRVTTASWSSETALWTVTAEHDGAPARFTCRFLYLCGGYYRYSAGYEPPFRARERFQGTFVHPQHWPEGLDYAGKRVVVIGSGATAVTLVPEMAKTAAHVTMLQRSPTYVFSRPAEDRLANWLRARLPARLAYGLVRWRNVLGNAFTYRLSRARPSLVKRRLVELARQQLGPELDVRHFTPSYDPWDQRICLVPDGDLFKALRSGQASVVTDTIETFTETGVRLSSGAELTADIIVSATGLELLPLNGIAVIVDEQAVDPGQVLAYRACMYEGVPNLASAFGYTNASWTLKADLTSEFVCRLLNHMRWTRRRQCTPLNDDPAMPRLPFLDFTSGYVRRAMDRFPKQGARAPWRVRQNYLLDLLSFRTGRLEDGALRFSNPEPDASKT
ncbi:flavin-containing monooxygenase [Phenylobacterium deserti]|uniref:FAD-containing monooxygenase EthA n=1 Tax=Phenylobacterium deserti TaxID=1914756 RepID=A0A328ARV8_9CAUL|nr:NAD(P)/FAD-dependent oxidoreductase [Phenylobacterium deserti]RAK56456.1 FAD-containing monooxygenase EthA [Phenylobacterium deserti]